MPLSSYVAGNGTISASTTSNVVTGIGTYFLSNLTTGASIANVSNVFVGYVAYITSNTSLTLVANANVAVSSNSYKFATYIPNVANVTYNTVGNISASTLTNFIVGNNTSFISNVAIGDFLYKASGNTYLNGMDTMIGTVSIIFDNNLLALEANSYANVTDCQFYTVKPNYTYDRTSGSPNPHYRDVNSFDGLHVINSRIFDWAYAGLVPGASMVEKYHPPMRDPVTGIQVHLPATIFTNRIPKQTEILYDKSNVSILNTNTPVNLIGSYSALTSGINKIGQDFIVNEFDIEEKIFGNDVSHVHRHLANSSILKRTALKTDDDGAYFQTISKLIPNTHVSEFARAINANIITTVDTLKDAKEYFSRIGKTEEAKNQKGINFNTVTDNSLIPSTVELKKVIPTGAPIAIPGLLNVRISSDEPTDTTWVPLIYRPAAVK